MKPILFFILSVRTDAISFFPGDELLCLEMTSKHPSSGHIHVNHPMAYLIVFVLCVIFVKYVLHI